MGPDEQGEEKEHVWELTASRQLKSDRCPPRVLDQIIQVMFPFAALRRFDFYARLLSVESINDVKYEGSEDSEPDAANRKGSGRAASDNETCNRNLVWRDLRFAKK